MDTPALPPTTFHDRTVWITGASSGIGRALALAFSEAGAQIVLSGRREDALEAVAAELKTASLILPFDTTDFAALPDLTRRAWEFAPVDILVNNAGISQRSLALDTKPEVYERLLDVDLLAPILLTQANLPKMVARGSGHIVAISSVAGRIGPPLRTGYAAAKHGLIGYMDSLRTEIGAHGLHVTNILPGSIATDVARNALTADGSARGASDPIIDAAPGPDELAVAVLQAVANREPERLFAQGRERDAALLRHADPDSFFQLMGQLGATIVEQQG